MTWVAAIAFLRKHGSAIGIGLLLVLGTALLMYVSNLASTVSAQAGQISSLKTDLSNERLARKRDVDALTTLSQGLTKAATDTAKDQRALTETIDAANPAPASPGLASFLERLRKDDSARASGSAGRTGH